MTSLMKCEYDNEKSLCFKNYNDLMCDTISNL